MKKKFFLFLFSMLALVPRVSAHCPLCTIGAGAAAAGAVWLGVSKVVVALFIGAFSMSMGMWCSRVLGKKGNYIPFQSALIIIGIFALTIWPLMPIFKTIGPLYLSFIGEYGKTYAFNYSIVSTLFGGLIVFISPYLSKSITKRREGKILPFQGIILTFFLLIILGIFIQFNLTNLGENTIPGSIERLSPSEFEKIIQNESVFLLNVHTPYQGQIEGTDEIIENWENIEKDMDKLPKDTSIPIAVYCRSGRMSETVAESLKEMGYQKIYDLEGGMNSWKESGRKII